MKQDINTNIDRIIAKIDNDFNPDNSDWIPRVGAWAIDAMSMIDCLRLKKIKKKLIVKDRIAFSSCELGDNIKVFDANGCRVYSIEEQIDGNCCGSHSTGEKERAICVDLSQTTHFDVNPNNPQASHVHAETVNSKSWPGRYNYTNVYDEGKANNVRNYIRINSKQLELNFNAEFVYVEYEGVETECSKVYGCELPVVPNNALLIEYIVYYCMYKMLCRGYKHPVMNLQASQYGTNPYYEYNRLKEEARRSVINKGFDDNEAVDNLWRTAFYIETFDPRR